MKTNSIWLIAVGLLIAACGDNNGGSNQARDGSTAASEATTPVASGEQPPAEPSPVTPVASRCTSTATSAIAILYLDGHRYMSSSEGSVMTAAYLNLKAIGACEGGQNSRCSILGGNNQYRIVIDGIATATFPGETIRNIHFEKLIESGFCKEGVAPRCTLQPGNVLAVDGVGAHYDNPGELINQLRSLKANGTCQ